MTTRRKASIEDLYHIPEDGKAELVNGELVIMEPTGFLPSRATFRICASLHEYERRTGSGFAVSENAGYTVNLPNRESFSPDAAFFTGKPTGMKFLQGAPIFAAEVRSEGDYGPSAEKNMAAKRADYFAAGTEVVWDVDLLGDGVVRVYRSTERDHPASYGRGEIAEAEPAVPGWTIPVDELFS